MARGGQERLYGKPTTDKVLWRGEPSSIWRGTQALTQGRSHAKNLPRAIGKAGGLDDFTIANTYPVRHLSQVVTAIQPSSWRILQFPCGECHNSSDSASCLYRRLPLLLHQRKKAAGVLYGCVRMTNRLDPWGSGAVEIATRDCKAAPLYSGLQRVPTLHPFYHLQDISRTNNQFQMID